MKKILAILIMAVACTQAYAAKSCDELKGEIAAKIDANGVKAYSLEIVNADAVKDRKVVGSCEGGTKKIVYEKK